MSAPDGQKPAKLLLTPEEAAEVLAISRTRLYELLRRGEIRSVKIGKVRRVSVRALEAYVEQLQEEVRPLTARPGRVM
ncbi:MAG: helix-turn-helix domain-containing protein [Chloroflexota bacterium]|nr:helix-turn-helix domain-containing protein [Chloroflexota bacterium]